MLDSSVDEAPSRAPGGLAICLTYYLPNISGLTLSAHELALHVRGLGVSVKVVTSRTPQDAPFRESVGGIEIIRSEALFGLGKALVMPSYPIDLWRSLDGISVVNVHLPCMDAAAVALVAKLRGRKLIVSYICSMSRATLKDNMMRAVASISHLVAGLLADSIQVVSIDYAESSVFCRWFRNKLKPAPLPISVRLFPGETYPPRKNSQRKVEQPYRIGYVGRIAKQKSLGVLFDSIPFLKAELDRPFVIDLVGPAADVVGEDYWRGVLQTAENSGGLIRYIGVLTGRALADYYSTLDVLVLPSVDRQESFGLVQIEAMLRRVPVVASDLPGMRTPVKATQMGKLFRAGDARQLAAAIADVLKNGPERELEPAELESLFGNAVACAPYVEALKDAPSMPY